MTDAQLKKHLQALLQASHLDDPEADAHVDRAVEMGISEFWGAYPWTFKAVEDSMTLTASQDQYDLPDDFESIKSILH